MRRFACERCGHEVGFAALDCPSCGAALGYDPDAGEIRELLPTVWPVAFTVRGVGRLRWRCLNAAWGCNWTLTAHTAAVWCRSCALTRGRPADDRPDAVAAWAVVEAAKRRVIHHLDDLGLPVVPRSSDPSDGLAFDFVSLPDTGVITGYHAGVVTIDLAEVDDVHREELRHRFDERSRTILGHLRHEIGHHLRVSLVEQPGDTVAFRALFGDERADYASALAEHYAQRPVWDADRFVSAYAASHPLEDWAETFALYLTVLDTTSTAAAHGLVAPGAHDGPAAGIDLDAILDGWPRLAGSLDAVAHAAGFRSPLDPHLPDEVRAKVAYVHERACRAVRTTVAASA